MRLYEERLGVPRTWYWLAALPGAMAALVLLPFGPVAAAGGLTVVVALTALGLHAYGTARIVVTNGHLTAGSMRLPVASLGMTEILDAEEAFPPTESGRRAADPGYRTARRRPERGAEHRPTRARARTWRSMGEATADVSGGTGEEDGRDVPEFTLPDQPAVALWDGGPPRHRRTVLQGHVSRTRAAWLADADADAHGIALVTLDGGHVLRAPGGHVDSLRGFLAAQDPDWTDVPPIGPGRAGVSGRTPPGLEHRRKRPGKVQPCQNSPLISLLAATEAIRPISRNCSTLWARHCRI